MTVTLISVLLAIIPFVLAISIIVLIPFFLRTTYLNYRKWVRYAIAITLLLYILIFKTCTAWIHIPELFASTPEIDDSVMSQIFVLHLPDFLLLISVIMMVFDRKNKVLPLFAPLTFFVGIIALVSNVLFLNSSEAATNAAFSWQYLFVGFDQSYLLYFTTFCNIMIGAWYTFSHRVAILNYFIVNMLILIFYYLYIVLISNTFDINGYVSGISNGEYIVGGSFYFFSWISILITGGYEYWIVSMLFYFAALVIGLFLSLCMFSHIQKSSLYHIPENRLVFEWNRFHRIKSRQVIETIDDAKYDKPGWKYLDENLPYNKNLDKNLEK